MYEKDAGLWHDLGQVKKAAGDEAGAQADFEKARTIEPRFVPPLVQLATLALRRENWQAVVEYGQEAVAINPVDYPETWLYLATARLKLGDSEQAERDARKAIDGSKPVLKAHHILGVALALQNRTDEAIEQLRIYVQRAPKGPETEAVRRQIEALEAERR
ncbi:MAG: tetratricopeptide repeat protein [Bryobacteraceae bacterium]